MGKMKILKITSILFLIIFWGLSFSLGRGFAQENNDATDPAEEKIIRQRITLSLRNIDIVEALKFLSIKSGLNIVPTQQVSGRVTLNVENAPLRDVFDLMLRSNNLAYDKRGNIYNVMTEAEYRKLFGKDFFDTRKVKVFHLKYAVPEQAFNLLDALKSEIGRLLVEPESGTVMLMDTPERLKEAEEALKGLEQNNTIRIFTLKYARAREVEEQLKNQLDLKKVGMVRADERTNQVIVQTLPERMKNIEEIINSLDKKTKGVLIDTKIIKIRLTDQLSEGIQWEGLFQIAKQFGLTYIGSYPFSAMNAGTILPSFQTRRGVYQSAQEIGYYPFSGTTSSLDTSVKVTPGKNMHIGIIDRKRDFDVLINYLKTLGKTKIIASPSLSVINNQEAKIHIGEKRAYVTTTTTTGATTKTVSEEVTYIDVGVRLSVVPTINDEGYVTMRIKPEISSVIDNIQTSSGNIIPILDTNTAETTVIAKDGATIVIGGLGREEKLESSEGVPVLSRLPLLGFLFRSSSKSMERVELLIMLTPIIVEGDRFIGPQEAQQLAPKPLKKFDVFKPETPLRDINFIPVKTELMPKDFKKIERESFSLALGKEVPAERIFSEKLEIKSFKPYEERDIKDIRKQEGEEYKKSLQYLQIKGFRPYE